MTEWRTWELGDLVLAAGGHIKTGPFGSQLHSREYTDDPLGIPVVMPRDMVRGRIDRESVSRVDRATAIRLDTHRLSGGDVVLARRGDVGRFAYVAEDEAGWLCGTGSMRVHAPDRDHVWPGFMRYAMSNPAIGEWLTAQAVGATMPNLNAAIVARLPVSVPGIALQREIAAALEGFDELIAINERRIALLENLVQSLYREWFVRLRFPGHRDESFADSALGTIPETWNVRPAAAVLEINPRIATRQNEYRKLAMADVNERFSYAVSSSTVARPSGSRFVFDDVVMARITPCLENGKTALIKCLRSGEVGVGSTEFIVLRGTTVGPAFVYCAARSESFRSHAIKSMSGASGRQRVDTASFKDLLLVEPTPFIASYFEAVAGPMLDEVFALHQYNRSLEAARDHVLPRLVTGRLGVSQIDLGDLLPSDAA